jgi:hypothetical protein
VKDSAQFHPAGQVGALYLNKMSSSGHYGDTQFDPARRHSSFSASWFRFAFLEKLYGSSLVRHSAGNAVAGM